MRVHSASEPLNATGVDLKEFLGRLPDPYSAVESVRALVEFLEPHARECGDRGRPPRYARVDEIKAQLMELAGPLMPCLRHPGVHGGDECRLSRRVVAEAAWDRMEVTAHQGAHKIAYRGKDAMWSLLGDGVAMAWSALQLAVAVAVAQETNGEMWVEAFLGLLRNGGRPQGGPQVRTARNIAGFWGMSQEGDLEDRLRMLHNLLRTHIVVPSRPDSPTVTHGRRRGAGKHYVEASRRFGRRRIERFVDSHSLDMQLSAAKAVGHRLRDLLGGDQSQHGWGINLIRPRDRWDWLCLYMRVRVNTWNDAAQGYKARLHEHAEEREDTLGDGEEWRSIPLDSEGKWDGFEMTKHGRRASAREPDDEEQ